MPHIYIEYNSAAEARLSIETLVSNLHAKAVDHDALPTGGIRTRAYRADHARVGDGNSKNAFIYITVRLGQGRPETVRRNIGEALFGVLTDLTDSVFSDVQPLSLGLEIQEIEKDWTWKKNNIHQIIKDKT